jgi:hypothetical protein
MFFANQHRSQTKTRNSTNVPMHHFVRSCCGIHFVTCWNFLAVSVVTGPNFLTISAVTDWKYPAVSVVTCRDFLTVTFPVWGNVKSLSPGTRRLGFSSRISSYWPGFSGHNFSALSKLWPLIYARESTFQKCKII